MNTIVNVPNKLIVLLVKNNPFDKSECMQNKLMLCNIETKEVVSDLDFNEKLKEGMIFDTNNITFTYQNKRSKHLEVNDVVIFGGGMYKGTIKKIKQKEKDAWDWNDTFILEDCEIIEDLVVDTLPNSISIFRSECEQKKYLIGEVNDPYYTELKYTQYEVDQLLKNKNNG